LKGYDISKIREDFPITKEYTYLDNAGLSPLPVQVIKAITNFIEERSLVGALNYFTSWQELIKDVSILFGKLINADIDEIALTRNTTEGINIVANMLNLKKGDNVIINDLEFPANIFPWTRFKKYGVEVRVIKNKNGMIDLLDIEKEIDENTRVVSVSHVQSTNGFKIDLEALGKITNEHGIYLCVDAIQSVGVLPVDVRKCKVDFLACGGHKWLFAPLGTGFFYCRKELISQFEPAYVGLLGAKRQTNLGTSFQDWHPVDTARRFMHGNISFSGFAGAKAGIEYINRIGIKNIEKRVIALGDLLIELLQDKNPIYLAPLDKKYRSAAITFKVPNVETVFKKLDENKVIVAPRIGGLRVSPNFYNTEEEIKKLGEIVTKFNI